MFSTNDIRKAFLDFFTAKGHKFVPSSSIVPAGDESLLFANAGMNQFKDIFLGLKPPQYRRVVNSQKCLRVSGKHNDLEEVGKDSYHHTFFEMLGNWSFDDYFKAETIQWAWELFTEVWGISPDRLWATVFEGDEEDGCPPDSEAKSLWHKITGLPTERVIYAGRKDNFWEMGETGPCGPCSEIHIDLGADACDKKGSPGHKCRINGECSRFIEIWNLVFIQYNRGQDGRLIPLRANYVDTGAGLERIAAVLENKKSNYDTDLFMPVIDALGELSGAKYGSRLHNKNDNAFRVIADHIRALVFAITDGAMPSNEGRGYVIRRILRRASRYGRELSLHEPFLYRLVPLVVDCMSDAFAEIKQRSDYVSTVIKSEEESFGRTLEKGIEIFNTAAEKAVKKSDRTISGDDAFQLYDTYGFPLDLTELMAVEQGLCVDKGKFKDLMSEQKERARAAQKNSSIASVVSESQLPATRDSDKYQADKCRARIIGWLDNEGLNEKGAVPADKAVSVILDRTCFYAEAGGQVGDCGFIEAQGGRFTVENTLKIAECVLHKGKVAEGKLSVGDVVTAGVSKDRNSIRKNHTATHLLQWALQSVCGGQVQQQGSLVAPQYLRFDFTYPKALTGEQIRQVEEFIREKIAQDVPVTCVEMPIEEAKKLGAMALFGEKYGEDVRVVAVGAKQAQDISDAFSMEFCGGTHVAETGRIGGFKIVKEESISAGVRRITALTGAGLMDYLERRSEIAGRLAESLKVPPEQVPERVEKLISDNKKLAKQLKSAVKQSGSDTLGEARQLLESCEKIGGTSVVVGRLSSTSIQQGREAVDMIKKKAGSAAAVIGFANGDKVMLLAGVTEDVIKNGLLASDIVKTISPVIGGGGGGRPQMAQAGGTKPQELDEALRQAAELIKKTLADR